MFRFQAVVLATALLIISAAFSPCQAALVFNFSYNFPGDPAASASGVITTSDTPTGLGFEIISITGFRTLTTSSPSSAVQQPITSLLPVGLYYNSNLLYPSGPTFLDGDGLSFTAGASPVNVYFSAGNGYTEVIDGVGFGTFTISQVTTSQTPEPGSALLLGAGLMLLSAWRTMRSRKRL